MNFAQLLAPLAAGSSLVYFCYRPADKRVLYVSPNYEQVLGGNAAAVNEELPTWLADLHPDDRRYLAEVVAALTPGRPARELTLRQPRFDGHIRWLCLTIMALPEADAEGPLLGGYLSDISNTQNILENANAFQAKKDSMLEILSHDLAAPLVLAEQMTDYLAERTAVLNDPQLTGMLDRLRQNCQEGVTLIRDFVDNEFLVSANVDLALVRLDLAERLRQVLDNYQQRAHAAGHQFFFQTSEPTIYADVDTNKLMQVVNNLVGNAMKFTPDGGRITVALSQHPRHLLLTVADNGIGIPASKQPVLFERFTPARRPGLRGEKSTGLGMSIIRTIVQLHRGRIWFESQEGVGTTFYIELPRPELD